MASKILIAVILVVAMFALISQTEAYYGGGRGFARSGFRAGLAAGAAYGSFAALGAYGGLGLGLGLGYGYGYGLPLGVLYG